MNCCPPYKQSKVTHSHRFYWMPRSRSWLMQWGKPEQKGWKSDTREGTVFIWGHSCENSKSKTIHELLESIMNLVKLTRHLISRLYSDVPRFRACGTGDQQGGQSPWPTAQAEAGDALSRQGFQSNGPSTKDMNPNPTPYIKLNWGRPYVRA